MSSVLGAAGCWNYHKNCWCNQIEIKDNEFSCRKYGKLSLHYRYHNEPIRAKECGNETGIILGVKNES